MSNRSSFLRQLLTSPQYQALIQLAEDLINEKKSTTSRRGKDEFETIWKVAEEEGYIQGIKQLLEKAETEAGKE